MRALSLLLLLCTGPTLACGTLEPEEQRRRDNEDITLQIQLAEVLARQADVVFLGRVVKINETESVANVTVKRVLKGRSNTSLRLPASDLEGITISCRASDLFRNSQLHASRRYIFYLQGERLLRAGWTDRGNGDLSLQKEVNIVLRASGT